MATPNSQKSPITRFPGNPFRSQPPPSMQSAISAANSLLRSAEFVLPKQKRLLAAKEYKHAVVTRKRKSKANHDEEGLIMLPQDVLLHIFSFLDFQSLISASAVCRTWIAAARDNQLWKILYSTSFCKLSNVLKLSMITDEKNSSSPNDIDAGIDVEWRFAFKTAYTEICTRKPKSHRGYCFSCCSIIWLKSNKCYHEIEPISTQQIVDYIIDGLSLESSPSDSDGDEEYL